MSEQTENPSNIVHPLQDDSLRGRLRENCQAIAVNEYSLELQAQRYIQLYQSIIV